MKRLLPLVILLAGCAELGAIGTGLQTARNVAKTACAILEGTDGSSTAVLAALAKLQQQIVEQQASDAAEKGADRAQVAAQLQALAAIAEAQRVAWAPLATLAGDRPVKLAPCPVTCIASPTCVLDAPGQPPALAGQACSGGVCDGAGKCCAVAP